MSGAGKAWAAGEDAMAAVAPEGGLFARLDPVSFTNSLLAVARRASRNPVAASGAFWQFTSALARIGPETMVRWLGRDVAWPGWGGQPTADGNQARPVGQRDQGSRRAERPTPGGRTLARDKRTRHGRRTRRSSRSGARTSPPSSWPTTCWPPEAATR
jgi:hypothetical protein